MCIQWNWSTPGQNKIKSVLVWFIWLIGQGVSLAWRYILPQTWARPHDQVFVYYLVSSRTWGHLYTKWGSQFLKHARIGVCAATTEKGKDYLSVPAYFNCLRATVRLYGSLIHCNSLLLQKVYLSSRNPSCWTSRLLFAMNGLHRTYSFLQKVRSANLLDLSQLVVDFRSWHLVEDNFLLIVLKTWIAKNPIIITGVLSQPRMLTLCIPLIFYQVSAPGFAQTHRAHHVPILPLCPHSLSSASYLDWQRFSFLWPLWYPKWCARWTASCFFQLFTPLVCSLLLKDASLLSGPFLSLSSISSQVVLYLSSTHLVQSFDVFAFINPFLCKLFSFLWAG